MVQFCTCVSVKPCIYIHTHIILGIIVDKSNDKNNRRLFRVKVIYKKCKKKPCCLLSFDLSTMVARILIFATISVYIYIIIYIYIYIYIYMYTHPDVLQVFGTKCF